MSLIDIAKDIEEYMNYYQCTCIIGEMCKGCKTVKCNKPIKEDAINPKHYKTATGMDVFDVAVDWHIVNPAQQMGLKYILRAGKKGDYVEDIDKAIKCLQRAKEIHLKNAGKES